ncbi:MAG: AAA family ATPase, partial [Planctomycetota bacterium]|nr:AAA family ATPase [Planctomycetota bacterium]
GGKGYYRGTSILVSGTAGTGKTSMAGHFVDAACRRGERCIYFAFEESSGQIVRNLKSIGLDLGRWVKRGLLKFVTSRPTRCGLEMHLAEIEAAIRGFQPHVVVIDPITNLTAIGSDIEIKATLTRLIDHLKSRAVTAMFTSLTEAGGPMETSTVGVSSLMDTWIVIRDAETGGERNRGLCILKSRGMAHSNQLREYLITPKGIRMTDVFIEAGAVLMGAARAEREAQAKVAEGERREEVQRQKRVIQQREAALAAQVAALEAERHAQAMELSKLLAEDQSRTQAAARDREQKRRLRQGDA